MLLKDKQKLVCTGAFLVNIASSWQPSWLMKSSSVFYGNLGDYLVLTIEFPLKKMNPYLASYLVLNTNVEFSAPNFLLVLKRSCTKSKKSHIAAVLQT